MPEGAQASQDAQGLPPEQCPHGDQGIQALQGLRYHLRTFGCQMNRHDSERVAGMLDALGASECATAEEADLVVFMTCCVREAADVRLTGQVASLKNLPYDGGRDSGDCDGGDGAVWCDSGDGAVWCDSCDSGDGAVLSQPAQCDSGDGT
ncbi:MAG: hypothetical protein LBL86_07865, partial [Coriobacteriales bacterium]|nr:hypothetical protein [Coriobacteriales bacterium]